MKNQKSPFWLKNFEREVGVSEVPGPGDNPRILEYFKSIYPNFKDINWKDSDAWCAVALNFVLVSSGMSGTNSPAAIDFLQWGRPLKKPRKGCVAVLRRGPDAWMSHVGLVVDERGNEILLLGGNQDNAVGLKWYSKTKVRPNGYRWPLRIEIDEAIKRRGHIRGGGDIVPEYPQPRNFEIDTTVKWYERADWRTVVQTVLGAVGAFLQVNPRFVVLGDALLKWGEKVKRSEKTSIEKLIDTIIEFFRALIKKLKSDVNHK